jgi:hypothetical protein
MLAARLRKSQQLVKLSSTARENFLDSSQSQRSTQARFYPVANPDLASF